MTARCNFVHPGFDPSFAPCWNEHYSSIVTQAVSWKYSRTYWGVYFELFFSPFRASYCVSIYLRVAINASIRTYGLHFVVAGTKIAKKWFPQRGVHVSKARLYNDKFHLVIAMIVVRSTAAAISVM